ncbi:MAG: hypothetical protein CVU77_04415 [Elusimicrobia bacterium HGW-Elusimicrobia-1]|jgi:integrase|nr:MAG: hypothetical protein CVU77_04415 [Elusimicrobia bacterium HGW-Elusimicrobia-1]
MSVFWKKGKWWMDYYIGSRRKRDDVLKCDDLDELPHILAACKNPRSRLSSLIALYTGMRPAEIIALKWSDINFDKGIIILTKNARLRALPMPDFMKKTLLDCRSRSDEPRVFRDYKSRRQ